jgi:transglutaminase-like putative cysteine protease
VTFEQGILHGAILDGAILDGAILDGAILDGPALDAPPLDLHNLDLDGASRVTYLIEQSFRYEYIHPISKMRHRLVVLPPARHGNQHLRAHRLEIAGANVRRITTRDARGNTIVRVLADYVEQSVHFQMKALLERVRSDGPVLLSALALRDPRLLRDSRLTAPDERLRELARGVAGGAGKYATPLEVAGRICALVPTLMAYEYGRTTVQTTAADALAGGLGVCQDYAHIMLAMCHALGIPARYVSGHLLGQGGTHAWVEVVTPHGAMAVATPFDPCNGVAASARYLTVATGRDYADVAPTSGSYIGPSGGRLTTNRRVAVLAAA